MTDRAVIVLLPLVLVNDNFVILEAVADDNLNFCAFDIGSANSRLAVIADEKNGVDIDLGAFSASIRSTWSWAPFSALYCLPLYSTSAYILNL